MRFLSFPFLASSLLLLALCQPGTAWSRVDTLRTFPQKRFVNGIMDFGQYMAKNLRYPLQAQQAAVMGTELVSVTIAPAGKLAGITVINSLGKAIDQEVTRAIHKTDKLWLPADPAASQDSIMLFLPFKFTLTDRSGYKTFYVETIKPDFILDETVLVGYSPQLTYNVHDDAYYVSELAAALQKKDHKRMLKMVDELIRRNPYSDKLYLQRARVEQELGQTDAACSDYKKIIYFLGRASFPKKFIENCPELPKQGGTGTTSVQASGESPIEEEIFTVCDVPPSFPDGPAELSNYLQQNLRYPEAALSKKIQGKVLISFIVTKEGGIQDVHVLKGPGHGTNEEAVRLAQNMPNWIPGQQSGRPVNVKYSLMIPFRLGDSN